MNDKLIKKLADEAEFSEKDLHIQNDNFQKFAESIVRECIAQVRKEKNGPAYEAAGRIAEHFGIE